MKHKLRRQFTEEYREQQNSMKRIGLISDTHGTFDQTLKTFLKDVDEIWHAGDIGSPEVADQIAAFKPLRAVARIQSLRPKIFIAGHSHILKVIYDPVYDLLHLNPGAAGCYGFHKVRSALRFTIDGTDIRDMEIGEWPRPGA